jgi:hypothetical protein
MVVTTISIVESKGRITTVGKIVSVSIGQSELSAARVVAIIGDEGPSILAFDPGYVVFGAFEGAGGELGSAGDDGGHGLLGQSEAGDGEDGGELHSCWIGVLGWSGLV